jgi:hypothetical protein
MSQAADPAPGMLFTEALRILGDRYGIPNIGHNPVNGDVVIHLPVSEVAELLWPYIFTDMQAKYLAVHPLSDEDIRRNRFPHDWPAKTDGASASKG